MGRPAARSADAGAARHHFAVDVLRDAPGDPAAAVEALVEAVASRLGPPGADALARVGLFLPAPIRFEDAEPIVARVLGEPCPPLELFVQPVVGGGAAALTWSVTGDGVRVERAEPSAARVVAPEVELAVLGHAAGEPPAATAGDFAAGLRRFDTRLQGLGLRFADAIKLWTVFPSTPELGTEQAFNEFNRGRVEVFDALDFHLSEGTGAPRYPASTGVGALDATAPLSGVALAGGARGVQVENPAQVSAFRYPTERIDKPALFSRAIAVDLGTHVMTYVAGTASTVGAKTAHVGDPAAQAEQTLNNIDTLITAENLARSGTPVTEGGLATLSHIVVYAATDEAEAAAVEVCARMVPPEVPMLMVRSRLTRDELLFEADGVAFAPSAAPAD
ncbi:MAG TPA: hypothetical protein VF517_09840 [Thermoleophilaceae bacterium]